MLRRSSPNRAASHDRPSKATTSAARAGDGFMVAMKQAVKPLGDARDDYAIFADIAASSRRRGSNSPKAASTWHGCDISIEDSRERAEGRASSCRLSTNSGRRESSSIRGRRAERVLLRAFRDDPRKAPLCRRHRGGSSCSRASSRLWVRGGSGPPVLARAGGMARRAARARFSAAPAVAISPQRACTASTTMARSAADSKMRGREPIVINPKDAIERGLSARRRGQGLQ